jgi:hypothetical protein
MCCFSQPVERVSDTNIFARSANGNQFLVYSMTYAALSDLAMVLPLPVPAAAADDAVRFINLERYPKFFTHMAGGFPTRSKGSIADSLSLEGMPRLKLEVHDVGNFEASFVPRLEDFDRLDERFRLPRQVWHELALYQDYGFAVFKLKTTSTLRVVHPMALMFPRRNVELLYFPTVHVHDRIIHAHAEFDHMLYCQPDEKIQDELLMEQDWQRSMRPASMLMNIALTEGVIEPGKYLWRRPLEGRLQNRDTLIGLRSEYPVMPSETP